MKPKPTDKPKKSIKCSRVGCRNRWVKEIKDGPCIIRLCKVHAEEIELDEWEAFIK